MGQREARERSWRWREGDPLKEVLPPSNTRPERRMERARPVVVVPVRGRPQEITWKVGLLDMSTAIMAQATYDSIVKIGSNRRKNGSKSY